MVYKYILENKSNTLSCNCNGGGLSCKCNQTGLSCNCGGLSDKEKVKKEREQLQLKVREVVKDELNKTDLAEVFVYEVANGNYDPAVDTLVKVVKKVCIGGGIEELKIYAKNYGLYALGGISLLTYLFASNFDIVKKRG